MTKEDGSVTFSLDELRKLEDERLKEEEAAARRKQEEVRLAREAEDARRREDEQRRLREVEARRQDEERRSREEEVRLAAIRDGALQQAKLLAASEIRVAEAERRREHEAVLDRLRRDAEVRGLRRGTAFGGALGVVMLVVLAVGYFGWLRPAVAHTEAVAAAAAADREALRAEMAKKDAATKEQIDGLAGALAAARAENDRLHDQLDAKCARHGGPSAPSGGRSHTSSGAPATSAGAGDGCRPGDPLCPTIGH